MMIRAITAITNAATAKIPISSALERPPLPDELAGGATVTGPVLALGVCVCVVDGNSDVAGLVAPVAAAPAGSASATTPAAAATATARRRPSLAVTIPSWRKIAAI
jgi:hypothetical protein